MYKPICVYCQQFYKSYCPCREVEKPFFFQKNMIWFGCVTDNNREETGFRPIRDTQRYQSVDISEHLQQLDGDIREFTMQLQNEKWE